LQYNRPSEIFDAPEILHLLKYLQTQGHAAAETGTFRHREHLNITGYRRFGFPHVRE
jgi:hypothetical protein